MAEESSPPVSDASGSERAWLAYVAPMAVFIIVTALEGYALQHYVWVYIGKVCAVTATLIACRSAWKDIRFEARVVPLALLVGLAVFVAWVALDPYYRHFDLGKRVGFDPFQKIGDPSLRLLFLGFRLYGLVLLVPVVEELFWRSFLLRWITEPDFQRVPMGTFSWMAFVVVAVAFGLAHPEWLAAILCAMAYALLLRSTRSLFACIVAHAVTNLALGIYILSTHHWYFW